jgi:hypothetical protein
MSTFTKKHSDDAKLLHSASVKTVKAQIPKFADAFEKRVSELQRDLDASLEKLDSIRTSGRYSADGERAERRLAARAMQEKLATVRADTVGKLEAQLAEQRAAAVKPKNQTTDPVLLLRQELRHRELRDQLRTLDQLTLQTRIKQAVDDGANTDLLDALEGAPAGFPIAPAELVRETRESIALKNHPELGELAQLRDAYTYALGVVEQTVLAATGLSAAEVATEPAPAQAQRAGA